MQHALPQWVKDFLRNYVGITTGEPQIAADLRCRQSRQSRATSGHLEGADRRIVSGVRFSGDRTKFGPPPLAPARDVRQVECPTKAHASLPVAPRRANSSAPSSTEPNRRVRRSRT